MSFDVARMKRMVWWGLPLMVGIAAFAIWIFIDDVPRMYFEVQQQSPSLRIRLGSVWLPLAACFPSAMVILMPLRIFRLEKWASWVEKRLVGGSLIACLISLPIVLIGGRILQQTYLPPMGYSECNKLSGAPSVYFTDWVKDPAWCVYKKDHAWVREQAAKTDAAKAEHGGAVSAPSK